MSEPHGRITETPDMETVIETRAKAALDAILAELPENQRPGRVVYLVPGDSIVWDFEGDCAGGQLTARLSALVPHISGGRTAFISPCTIDYWTATIEVTLLRCAATIDNSGAAPTPTKLSADGLAGARDLRVMLEAITGLDFVDGIGAWLPQGPNAGTYGNQWTFTTKLDATPCE